MLNSVVKISLMSAKYFEYYTIILRGAGFFVDTLYIFDPWKETAAVLMCRFLLVMPGYSSSDDALATKLISFYPENVERPTHQAWIMLFEPTNGDLHAV